MPLRRVNIGCGQSPTPGWLNYDNSLSIRLAKYPLIVSVLERFGLLEEEQKIFISFAKETDIMWADATKHIPLENNSVDVLYASHMLEHLDREKVQIFLREAYRVLAPNGIIRIVVPDSESWLTSIFQKATQTRSWKELYWHPKGQERFLVD